MERLFITVVLKWWFTVVPKYKNLFLHINLKLVPFTQNLPVHSLH